MLVRTERLSLKVLRADKVALRRLAAAEGEPMSVIVRRILRDEFKRHGLWQPQGQQTPAEAVQRGD